MLSNRARARVLFGAVTIGLGAVGAASCGGNTSKVVLTAPGDAGAAGEAAAGAAAIGGGSSAGGPAGGGSEAGGGGAAPAAAGEGGLGGAFSEPAAGASNASAGAGGEAGGIETACAPVASRIQIAFDTTDPERVTSLQWLNATQTLSANVVGQGGPTTCSDPSEFFGESYGAPEGTVPVPVVAGHVATLAYCGSDATLTSGAQDCTQAAQIPVTTQYHFYGGAQASQMRITRSFGFNANTTFFTGTTGLRPYVARVALASLSTVIYPNAAGTAVTTTNSTSCGGDCFTAVGATWNGKWFADIDPSTTGTGLALIVLRDPAMTAPVDLTINYDSYSNANITSFVLLQPTAGWTAPISETEYLCFADLTSWPQSARDAAQLPAGCGP